jgi:hypothetical protein
LKPQNRGGKKWHTHTHSKSGRTQAQIKQIHTIFLYYMSLYVVEFFQIFFCVLVFLTLVRLWFMCVCHFLPLFSLASSVCVYVCPCLLLCGLSLVLVWFVCGCFVNWSVQAFRFSFIIFYFWSWNNTRWIKSTNTIRLIIRKLYP